MLLHVGRAMWVIQIVTKSEKSTVICFIRNALTDRLYMIIIHRHILQNADTPLFIIIHECTRVIGSDVDSVPNTFPLQTRHFHDKALL